MLCPASGLDGITALTPGEIILAVDVPRLEHRETLALAPDAAWAILSDPARIAACLPGVTLLRREGEAVAAQPGLWALIRAWWRGLFRG